MKKLLVILSVMTLSFSVAVNVRAEVFTFQPSMPNLRYLDHNYYYTWGIDWSLPSGVKISSASLVIDNIVNIDFSNDPNPSNVLYVSLLDSATNTVGYDVTAGNYFATQKELFQLASLGPAPQDFTYEFTSDEISSIESFISNDGNFGFGLDTDCLFWSENDGITLSINVSESVQVPEPMGVPEPASILLLGAGLILMAAFRGKNLFKK